MGPLNPIYIHTYILICFEISHEYLSNLSVCFGLPTLACVDPILAANFEVSYRIQLFNIQNRVRIGLFCNQRIVGTLRNRMQITPTTHHASILLTTSLPFSIGCCTFLGIYPRKQDDGESLSNFHPGYLLLMDLMGVLFR